MDPAAVCLPYHPWVNLYLTYNLNPLAGDTISAVMLMLALLAHGYRTKRPLWTALALFVLIVWLFLANPLWIVLLLPTSLAVGFAIMASHVRDAGFGRRTVFFLLPPLLFVILGGGAYLIGLYRDTAAVFFPQEMNISLGHTLRLCSVATVWNKGIDPIGGSWVVLALVGLGLAIRREGGTLRAVGLAVVAVLIFLLAYIAAYLTSPSWALPNPIYFEFTVWPFYALFAAHAVVTAIGHLLPKLREASPPLLRPWLPIQMRARPAFVLAMVGAAVTGVMLARHPFAVPSDLYKPPRETAITAMLRAESAIAPNAPFRGYTADLLGFKGPEGPPTDWFGTLADGNTAILAFGNTDRQPYLWRYGIPTVESYSQAVEPAVYAVITRLLDRAGDRQARSVTIVTRADIPLMESMGVRFLVADYPLEAPARRVAEVAAPLVSHFLYELPDPNDGGYSPTQVVVASDAAEVLRRIGDPNFDFRKTVVLDEPLDVSLQPADSSGATVVRGGWRVRAVSRGRSLLLLPLQFSSCLSLTAYQGDAGKVLALRRANLASTALVFEGAVDIRLLLHVSPFLGAHCRLRDAQELQSFGVAKLPKTIF